MKKKMNNFFKKIGVVVMTLAMLITMIPATEYSADTDINGPVIESVTFEQNGRTDLKAGDKLTLTFSGYDQESEIVFVYSSGVRDANGNFLQEFKGTAINGDGNTYTMEYLVEDLTIGECYVTSLEFVDSNNNTTKMNVDYSFKVVPNYDETTVVSIATDKPAIVFDENNLTGEITSTATISGNTKDISGLRVTYDVTNGEGFAYEDVFTFISTANGTYETKLSFENPTESRTYTVKSVYVNYTDNTGAFLANIPTFSFSIQNNISDKSAPEILSISIDKQGQILESGEVKFTVNAKDTSTLKETGAICLEAGVDNASPYAHVVLTHIGNGVYEGTVDVSTLYTCNYWISYVQIEDIFGNVNMYQANMNSELKNYNFGVMRDGVYLEGSYKNVNINFWNDWNDIEPIKEYEKDIPHSGISLGDLLGTDYFELSADPTLGAFVGWKDVWSGEVYTKDSIITASYDDDAINLVPKYEKVVYNICKSELNSKGNYSSTIVKHVSDKELTVSEILAIIGNGANVGSYTFTGWDTDYEDLNTKVTASEIWVYAEYDKYPVKVEFAYIDASGNVVTYTANTDYPAGTKLQKVYDDAIAAIGSANLTSVTGWRAAYDDVDTLLTYYDVGMNNYLNLVAEYTDKQIVKYYVDYVAEKDALGSVATYRGFVVLDKTSLNESTITDKVFSKIGTVPHWNALSFVDYQVDTYSRNGMIEEVYIDALYDNILLYLNAGENTSSVYNVTAGQVVTLPTELNGKQIGWEDWENEKIYYGSFTIPTDAVKGDRIYLYVTTNTNDAVVNESVSVQKPAVVLPPEKVEETVADIKDAIAKAETTGTTQQIVVDMKNEDGTIATQVPKEILEVAKGKNVEIVLNMGAYSWTINGNDIKAENLKDINLEVSLNTSNIPSDKIKQLAGNDKTYQLSLTHNGDFGFKASLTLNVGAENAGQYGNLYYYDSDGRLVFQNAGKIDASGNVSVSFSHASEYVIVISDTVAVSSPVTADVSNVGFYVGLMFVALSVMVVLSKKRSTI